MPFVSVITALLIVAEADSKHATLTRILNFIQATLGLSILSIALIRAYQDWATLSNLNTMRSVFMAPLLSIGLCPMIWLLMLHGKYDEIFVRMNCSERLDTQNRILLKFKVLIHCGLSLKRARDILTYGAGSLMNLKNPYPIDQIMRMDSL